MRTTELAISFKGMARTRTALLAAIRKDLDERGYAEGDTVYIPRAFLRHFTLEDLREGACVGVSESPDEKSCIIWNGELSREGGRLKAFVSYDSWYRHWHHAIGTYEFFDLLRQAVVAMRARGKEVSEPTDIEGHNVSMFEFGYSLESVNLGKAYHEARRIQRSIEKVADDMERRVREMVSDTLRAGIDGQRAAAMYIARTMEREIDLFVCYASEDKVGVVRPLIRKLASRGISVWHDEAEIEWGDSIVDKVSYGLKSSRYVLVVLSKVSVRKSWPRREVEVALNLEFSEGKKRVLPLMVGSDSDISEIVDAFPLIGGKRYVRWDLGIESVINELERLLS